MLTCPGCETRVRKGDGFCEGCGISLPPPCPSCGLLAFNLDGLCQFCGAPVSGSRDHVELEVRRAAGISNRGLRHPLNEDAMGASVFSYGMKKGIAAVVCDGVSNSPRPEIASQVAADTGTKVLTSQLSVGARPKAATTAAVKSAAKAVNALATSNDDAPACTYVSAVVSGDAITIGWVGDSRAYWLSTSNRTRSIQLTKDDNLLNHLTETGAMDEAEARKQPGSGALVQWLGADAEDVRPHIITYRPNAPGVVLICSDGLWSYLPEAEALANAVPDAAKAALPAARSLVKIALDGGGHDNITAVLIPFPPEGGHTDDRWF